MLPRTVHPTILISLQEFFQRTCGYVETYNIYGGTDRSNLALASQIARYFMNDLGSETIWENFRSSVKERMERHRQVYLTLSVSDADDAPVWFYYRFLEWWEGENPPYGLISIENFFWDWQKGISLDVAHLAELVSSAEYSGSQQANNHIDYVETFGHYLADSVQSIQGSAEDVRSRAHSTGMRSSAPTSLLRGWPDCGRLHYYESRGQPLAPQKPIKPSAAPKLPPKASRSADHATCFRGASLGR